MTDDRNMRWLRNMFGFNQETAELRFHTHYIEERRRNKSSGQPLGLTVIHEEESSVRTQPVTDLRPLRVAG